MIELKRINNICPVCGNRFKLITIDLCDDYVTSVKGNCGCGYCMSVDCPATTFFDLNRGFILPDTDEDAIDKWNKVNHNKEGGC